MPERTVAQNLTDEDRKFIIETLKLLEGVKQRLLRLLNKKA